MILGAVTHFSQGWSTSMLAKGQAISATSIRDEIDWNTVETAPGVYKFDNSRVSYVQKAVDLGLDVTLVFIPTNKLYDAGLTPHSPEALAAVANFVKATLAAFPGITAIEIGNEFNSNDFVSGVVKTDSYSQRDEHYMDLLSAVSKTVTNSFPDVKILGGAAHSVPVGYLTELFKKGALDLMDGVTIHPYTTPPEQLADQLDLLRDAMGDHQVPIYVTEFGQAFKSKEEAPAYLVKMTAVMAESNVASADWYALQEQKWFPNMELVDLSGAPTSAGKSFAFIQDVLLDKGVPKDVSQDSSSYFYLFGDRTMVLWGEDQTVTFSGPTTFYSARGEVIDRFDGHVRFDEPIIAISTQPIVVGQTFFTSGTGIVADSYHDFDVSNAPGSATGFEGPWSYYWLKDDVMKPLATMPGGEWQNEPWTPYIGSSYLRPLRVTATDINPVDFSPSGSPSSSKYSIVERFTAKSSDLLKITGHWDVDNASRDGVELTITHNGIEIIHKIIFNPLNGNVFDLVLEGVSVKAGDTIDFIVGSNLTPSGDNTSRHITIRSESKLATNQAGSAPEVVVGLEVVGTVSNDDLRGTAGNDKLDGLKGADVMAGGKGDDTYIVDNARDVIVENANEGTDTVKSSVSFVLSNSFVENLTLTGVGNVNATGNDLANTLIGNTGKNTLIGGLGSDTMIGGAGDDTYYVDNVGDRVMELDGEGADSVFSTVSYSIAGQAIERLQLTGEKAVNATGNALANIILGNDGDNVIDGGVGADALYGGKGNDTYYVDNAGDKAFELQGQGTDQVFSSVSYTLIGQYIENLTLTGLGAVNATGNNLDNVITGNAAANRIDGFIGADLMVGGKGDDVYVVDNGKDLIVEIAGEGIDTVLSSTSYVLSSFVENMTLTGVGNVNATGNDLANTLIGNTGKNILIGGLGSDTMIGGAGDDTYYVDNMGDRVVELDGEGVDRVFSTVSYSIAGQAIERLQLTGENDVNATGNALANIILGNDGDNVIDGGTGADNLYGGKGNDTYYVDNAGDRAFELQGQGTDQVFSSVSYTLIGQYIENLTLTGLSVVNATGNNLDNVITGNAAANRIDGLSGCDVLTGGAGKDVFIFSTNVGSTNVDTITDFDFADDTIQLSRAIFNGLSAGTLLPSAFVLGEAAQDASDRIIYNQTTGALFFDRDGSGSAKAVQFATLGNHVSLTHADFLIV